MDLVFRDVEVDINGERILKKVSGVARKGEMLAIMGPSGAGKSTLLSALAGRMSVSGGLITLNGDILDKQLSRKMRFVLQQDLFFPTLTLSETLTFAALLTLPERMPPHLKSQRVEEIISLLELTKCKNTVMGNQFLPGLSGGERKRATIGCEIMTDPSILLIDEPTSGLDYSIASNLVQTLKKYSGSRLKTIIASIHQPSSQMFHMFNNILLMADGQVVYFGACTGILEHFSRVGLTCRQHYNPADFIMEELRASSETQEQLIRETMESREKCWPSEIRAALKEGEASDVMRRHAQSRRGSVISVVAGFVNKGFRRASPSLNITTITEADQDTNDIEKGLPERNHVTAAHQSDSEQNGLVDTDVIVASYTDLRLKWPTGYWTQFRVLTRRLFIYNRHRIFSPVNVLRRLLIAIVTAILWFQMERSEETLNDRMGLIFFTTVFWGFDIILDALAAFHEERPIIQRERAAGLYRLSAYWLAKQTSELPLTLTMPLVFVLVFYWAVGLNYQAWSFFAYLALHLNFVLALQAVGLFLSMLILDFAAGLSTGTVVMISFMLLGGFFQRHLGRYVSWCKYLSPVAYAYQGLLFLELHYGDDLKCLPDNTTSYETCLENGNERVSGSEVLDTLDITLPFWSYYLILFFISILFRYFAYLALRFLRKPTNHK